MGDIDDFSIANAGEEPTEETSDLDGAIDETPDLGPTIVDESAPDRFRALDQSTFGRRLAGLLALVLGVVGVGASIVVGALILWAGITASSTVDEMVAPLAETIERVETRIDQADDAVDRDGIDADRMPELRARAEGLADVGIALQGLAVAITEHPVYGRLPADLAGLGAATDDLAGRTGRINELVSGTTDGRALPARTASEVTDELNTLQDDMTDLGDTLDDAAGSLKSWLRIGSLLGVVAAAWSGWAQVSLIRRGLRGLRGQPA